MTLNDWCERTGINPSQNLHGAIALVLPTNKYAQNIGRACVGDLWHLTDYAVSTVSGPTVWLVPDRHAHNR